MTISRTTTGRSRAVIITAIAAVAGALVVTGISQANAEQSGTAPGWSFRFDEPGPDSANVTRTAGVTTIRDTTLRRAAAGDGHGFGAGVSTPHTLPAATDRVVVRTDATTPVGTSLTTEIRGRTAAGRWTEWCTAVGNAPTVLADAVTAVQIRVNLLTDAHQTSPALRSVTVSAAGAVSARTPARAAPNAMASGGSSYRVYATREGLVGGTTANGHVIASKDHFVALPSTRVLNPQGHTDYSVQICYGRSGRCVVAPIWDVGPWNEHDDYWNPSARRERFTDLPQGKPEAQAAYQNGYNGGRDGFGRTVGNPAGIDLADGTFADLGLTDNDWVDVTYLWTGSSPAPSTTGHVYGLAPDRAHVSVYSGSGAGPAAWAQIGGVASKLYAGGAGLFATNPNDGSVNRYNGDGSWTRIGGPADSFAVTGLAIYGLSSDKSAVSVYNGTPGSWTVIGGAATQIYGGGAGLFAVNPNDGSISKYNGAAGSWTRIGGPADSFAVTGNALYGLARDKADVSVWNGTPGSWTVVGGAATRLYGGGAGLFAVNPNDGSISKYNGTPGSWTRIGGSASSFAVGATRLYGLAPDKSSVSVWSGNGTGWIGIGGPADSIAAN
jgi:hypothetical protein